MKIKHTDATVTTTIEWTETEKDVFISGIDEVMNDDGWMDNMPEEIKATMISFYKEF